MHRLPDRRILTIRPASMHCMSCRAQGDWKEQGQQGGRMPGMCAWLSCPLDKVSNLCGMLSWAIRTRRLNGMSIVPWWQVGGQNIWFVHSLRARLLWCRGRRQRFSGRRLQALPTRPLWCRCRNRVQDKGLHGLPSGQVWCKSDYCEGEYRCGMHCMSQWTVRPACWTTIHGERLRSLRGQESIFTCGTRRLPAWQPEIEAKLHPSTQAQLHQGQCD